MQTASEQPQLVDALVQLLDRLLERAREVGLDGRAEPSASRAEIRPHRGEPLLRAIPKIALEPVPGIVGGLHDSRP